MQEGVRKRVSFWGLPDYYRPLTGGEKALQVGMGALTILPLFIGFGLFLYSLDVHGYLYLPLPILGFLGLVLSVFYYWKLRLDNRDGVLNEAELRFTISGPVLKICYVRLHDWIRLNWKVLLFGIVSWSMQPYLAMRTRLVI